MEETICSRTENCPIYKNWVEQSKDNRLHVIQKSGGSYNCLAMIAIQDSVAEGGIHINEDLQKRLPKENGYECEITTQLNLFEEII